MRNTNVALLALISALAILGLHIGLRGYPPSEVWRALAVGETDATAIIIRDLRLPRAVLAVACGAALGLSGALMQGLARNPLAEPGLMGVNAGAALAVVCVLTIVPQAGFATIILAAAIGAMLAAGLVFGLALAAGGALAPVVTLLAGVSVAALAMAAVQVLIILNETTLEELIFWLSGSFADRPLTGVWAVIGIVALALVAGMRMAGGLDAVQTDDATATGLGVDVMRLRLAGLGLAALLAGAAVALAGPVAFVGLVAPHLARLTGAVGHRVLLPSAILFGSLLCVGADIAARFVLYPTEAPVSAVMALVGVPLLLVLLRRDRVRLA